MFEFEIFNYKTVKHIPRTSFEGYCTILGRNFIGKSAVMHAIAAPFKNPKGTSYIRDGEDYTETRLWINGHSIVWTKELTGSASYLIDGVHEFKKVTPGTVPEMLTEMGFGPIQVAGDKFDLYYAKQFESLFLVDQGRTNFVTDLLSAIYGIDVVYKALNLCGEQIRNTRNLKKVRDGDRQVAELSLKPFEALEEAQHSYEAAENASGAVEALQSESEYLSESLQALGVMKASLSKLASLKTLEIPEPPQLEALGVEVRSIQGWMDQLRDLGSRQLILNKALESLTVPESPDWVQDSLREMAELSKAHQRLIDLQKEVKAFSTLPEVLLPEAPELDFKEIDTLEGLYQEVVQLQARKSLLQGLEGITIPEPEQPEDPEPLRAYIKNVSQVQAEGQKLKESIRETESDLEEVQASLAEYPVCPACGSELGEGHAH